MAGIHFHSQDIPFKLKNSRLVADWLVKVAKKEKAGFASLDFIFCTDQFLSTINRDFLQHDEYTDIITFDYGDSRKSRQEIEGEVYISVQRVKENASTYQTLFEDELHRVMVHGVLHLCGYGDKTPAEKAEMRKKEDACLSLREFHVKP
ncbi:MAG TPA: rRNA maturation RNase YbeY [Anaerolineales bacterium]